MIVNHIHKIPRFTVRALKWERTINVAAHQKEEPHLPLITHNLTLKEARALRDALSAQIKNIKRRKK